MRSLKLVILFLTLIAFASCTTTKDFTIDVLNPAKKDLIFKDKNVVAISRNFKFTNDTLQNYYKKNQYFYKSKITANTDSIAIAACLGGFTSRLREKSNIKTIKTMDNNLPVQRGERIPKLSWNTVERICNDSNSDLLVSLETLTYLNVVRDYADQNSSEVITGAIWTVYDPFEKKIMDQYSKADTVYWEGLDELGNYSASRIPDRLTAIAQASQLVGEDYARQFVPSWQTVGRMFYSINNEDFQKAAKLADKNKWEEATSIWAKYQNSPKTRISYFANYNLAQASEMQGDLRKSLQYISECQKIAKIKSNAYFKTIANKYAKILKNRLNAEKKLNEQLNDTE